MAGFQWTSGLTRIVYWFCGRYCAAKWGGVEIWIEPRDGLGPCTLCGKVLR